MVAIVYMISGRLKGLGDVDGGLCPDIVVCHGLRGSLVDVFGLN